MLCRSGRRVRACVASTSQTATAALALSRDGDDWDSALGTFVYAVAGVAAGRGIEVDASGLPEGALKLVRLAQAVPATKVSHPEPDDALTAWVGEVALDAWGTFWDATEFLGETLLAFFAMLRHRARFRRVDLMHAFAAAGVGALGIVALINFLIGAVLAFVGAVQLEQFGAWIYVANLVAIGVARELGALMSGIVMCGRTGASFAVAASFSRSTWSASSVTPPPSSASRISTPSEGT